MNAPSYAPILMARVRSLAGAAFLAMVASSCSWLFPPSLTAHGNGPPHGLGYRQPQTSVVSPEALIGEFVVTGAMMMPRSYHTATLLHNGRVLIAGGDSWTGNSMTYLASAELYDPIARTFGAAGNMHAARADHVATLLRDRRVLIVGGARTAELFDPRTGTFSLTGRPVEGLGIASAILLIDGRVLITDGGGKFEIYNPSTGRFRETSHLHLAPTARAMDLQPDGKVLIDVRGNQPYYQDACLELFDPVTETFSVLRSADPRCARVNDAMQPNNGPSRSGTITVLRNGKMLLAGGPYCSQSGPTGSGVGAVVGVRLPCPPTAKVWIYDPSAKTKIEIEPMHAKRNGHTATLLNDGSVLIVGGTSEPNAPDAELYLPAGAGNS